MPLLLILIQSLSGTAANADGSYVAVPCTYTKVYALQNSLLIRTVTVAVDVVPRHRNLEGTAVAPLGLR